MVFVQRPLRPLLFELKQLLRPFLLAFLQLDLDFLQFLFTQLGILLNHLLPLHDLIVPLPFQRVNLGSESLFVFDILRQLLLQLAALLALLVNQDLVLVSLKFLLKFPDLLLVVLDDALVTLIVLVNLVLVLLLDGDEQFV